MTWASSLTRWASASGWSARMRRSRCRIEPCRRRMNALTVPAPMARPAQRSASRLVLDPVGDDLDQLPERAGRVAVDAHRPLAGSLGVGGQSGRHVVHDHRVLLTVVLGIGEEEGQQLVLAELLEGPEERGDPAVAAGHVGGGGGIVPPGRGPHRHAAEGPDGQVEVGVLGPLLVGQLGVLVVEEEEVLTLHVEDQGLGVDRLGPEHPRVEEAVEQEGGVAGLGGHAGDATDVDVGPLGPVQEVQVQVEGLLVPGQAGGEPAVHLVEEEGLVPGLALGPVHRRAGQGRDEDLGLEAGGLDQSGPADLGGQDPRLDQEDVAVQRGALVAGPDLAHHPVDLHRAPVGQGPLEGHDVVELEERVGADPDPELQRRGVLGPDHPAHGRHRSDRTAGL